MADTQSGRRRSDRRHQWTCGAGINRAGVALHDKTIEEIMNP